MNTEITVKAARDVTVKLPRRHAADWWDRCGTDEFGEEVASTERTITLSLTTAGVADLREDAEYYVDCMFGEFTDYVDYRPAARRCLAALRRAGL